VREGWKEAFSSIKEVLFQKDKKHMSTADNWRVDDLTNKQLASSSRGFLDAMESEERELIKKKSSLSLRKDPDSSVD